MDKRMEHETELLFRVQGLRLRVYGTLNPKPQALNTVMEWRVKWKRQWTMAHEMEIAT